MYIEQKHRNFIRGLFLTIFLMLIGTIFGVLSIDSKKAFCLNHSNMDNVVTCIRNVESEMFFSISISALLGLLSALIVLAIVWVINGEHSKS